jgi:type IV secretory pathway VirJ component
MKFWIPVLGIAYILFFSSCSILKRNRFANQQGAQSNELDLPIIEYPSKNPASRRLLVMLSGDGGWLEFNDQLAASFAKKGYNVIGFNSRSYFWEQRSPQQTADDLLRIIRHYTRTLKTNRLYLTGYSFGADVIPFVYNRLPLSTKRRVAALALFSPFATTDFMIRTSDLLNLSSDDKQYKVMPELQQVKIPVFCFYGENENPKALSTFKNRHFKLSQVAGDHHYESSANDKIINSFHTLRLIKF